MYLLQLVRALELLVHKWVTPHLAKLLELGEAAFNLIVEIWFFVDRGRSGSKG